MSDPCAVRLRLLGELELERDGESCALPRSKKTRALLAYLATVGRSVRRDRLCDIFWELPDDPRGALRWSLSKLRACVDDEQRQRLLAERETVALDTGDMDVDWLHLKLIADARALRRASLQDLQRAASNGGEFLADLELPRCDDYQAWLIAMREDVRQWQVAVLRELVGRDLDDDRAIVFAREWCALDPFDALARTTLVERLEAAGRREEAQQQREAGVRKLDEIEAPIPTALRTNRPVPGVRQEAPNDSAPLIVQHTQFCTASDGTGLAYSIAGSGSPLVKTANWLNHLDYDWDSPLWRHWIDALARDHRLIRYDERGNGLSDWNTPDISFEAFVDDLESVVDAADLDRFDLFGMSQGCAVSIAYAVRHPERVRRMVLYGGYVRGWAKRGSRAEIERREAMITLIRVGWGQDNPAFRQMFTTLFLPDAPIEETSWFNELQRVSTSPENAVRLQRAFAGIDVADLLGKVDVPTLVLHCQQDSVVPFFEGRSLAAGIAGAELVALDSRNHMILDSEPAWPRAIEAMRDFLARP